MRYSFLSLAANALSGNRHWAKAWRSPDPKPEYDAIIVGGGGHGLATAYYLAKNHGLTNIAVLEKGWLGGGNVVGTPPLFALTTRCLPMLNSMSTP